MIVAVALWLLVLGYAGIYIGWRQFTGNPIRFADAFLPAGVAPGG